MKDKDKDPPQICSSRNSYVHNENLPPPTFNHSKYEQIIEEILVGLQ